MLFPRGGAEDRDEGVSREADHDDDDEGVDASTLLVRFESNARGNNLAMPSLSQSAWMDLP
jgi:hypothetical protein